MRSDGYSTLCVCVCVCVCLCVCVSVCPHLFSHYAQQGGQKAIPTGSLPHWLDFQVSDFREKKNYGVKKSVKANRLMSTASPRPVFAALHTVIAVTQKSIKS